MSKIFKGTTERECVTSEAVEKGGKRNKECKNTLNTKEYRVERTQRKSRMHGKK